MESLRDYAAESPLLKQQKLTIEHIARYPIITYDLLLA